MPKFFSNETYLYFLGYRTDISLGNCYHHGIHTNVNFELARKYYSQALKTHRSTALYQLSLLANDEGNKGESFYFLGIRYEHIQEWQSSLTAYETAAKEGYAPALYHAGKLFNIDRFSTKNQVIIKKDVVKELFWYRKGATLGSIDAFNALIEMSESESKAALHLAEMYEHGEIENKISISNALSYYEKAFAMQSKEAAYRLGQIYQSGEMCVDKNSNKAFDYFLLAAAPNFKFGLNALSNLERIAKNLDNVLLICKVAEIYQNNFRNNLAAFKCYQLLIDRDDEVAFKSMKKLATINPECAFAWAKLSIEKNNLVQEKLIEKYHYFGLGVRGKHKESEQYLETLAESGDVDAKYTLASAYYDLKLFNKAVCLLIKLAEQKNESAITFIKNKSFSVDNYLLMAKHFDQENEFSTLSFYFYKKALSKKSKEAAFRLGKFYSNSLKNKDFDKACKYFVMAQQLGYSEADCYFELAKLYEKNTQIEEHLEVAYKHYTKAAFNHHKLALQYLEENALSGDMKAQFILANIYYQQKKIDSAIGWSLKAAEQKYEPAINFLNTVSVSKDHYLFIAKIYEQGTNEIKQNIEKSLFFYSKAYKEGDSSLAFHIGQLYLIIDQSTGLAIDLNKACEYFIKAIALGCKEAELTLEQLAENLNPDTQLRLGNLYRDPPLNNQIKALHWYHYAIEGKELDSELDLDAALIKMLETTGVEFSMHDLIRLAQPKLNSLSFNSFGIFSNQSSHSAENKKLFNISNKTFSVSDVNQQFKLKN